MSNYLAIATVTATLSTVIDAALRADVPGAEVKTLRPDALGNGAAPPTVNVFLYQATPNASWRNRDLPTRDAESRVTTRPLAALDLHYLLTFSGNDGELEPQRMMGSAIRALEERPVLVRDAIRSTIGSAPFSTFLAGSDLAEDVELVRFNPAALNLEELAKLWSVFFQVPYLLSTAYLAMVVLIEGTTTPRGALPVAARNVYAAPFRNPRIERVEPATGPGDPIVAGAEVAIGGRGLRGDDTRILVGGLEVTPSPDAVSDEEITVALPGGLRAGVHGVQVVHRRAIGTPPTPHRGVESNVAPFVLRPAIIKGPDDTYAITVSDRAESDGGVSATVVLELSPEVGRRQRVVLLLDELDAPDGRSPWSYRFPAPPRPPEDPETADTIAIPVSGVQAAEYLVRVQVEGAESLLDRDATGRYVAPMVDLT